MSELTVHNQIGAYLHCGECLKERPEDISPKDWATFEVGWTEFGLQVWCTRHDCNILNIDFEGQKHPAETSRLVPKELKLEVVK